MLILLCALLACRATPVEPGQSLQPPLPQSAATEQGCARLEVRVKGRETITVQDDTVEVSPDGSCAGLRPVISGTPEFDRPTNRVRLPVALQNNGTGAVQAPARLYGWEDSLIVIEAPGLAQNQWTASYLDFVAPDSALSDTAASFPGALLWRYDTLLAVGGLAAGDTSGPRWLDLAVHSGVKRFEVVLHAEASALSAEKPVIPSTMSWPDDSMHTVANPGDTAWVYYRTIAEVRFDDSTSGQTINAFIAKYDAQIVGGIPYLKSYIMQFPDPGPTWQDLISRTEEQLSEPGVLWVIPLTRRDGGKPIFYSRYPDDAMGHLRTDWLTSSSGTWSSSAIRAPLACGCETGMYGSEPIPIGMIGYGIEVTHDDLSGSNVHRVSISSGLNPSLITVNERDLADWHGTAVAGVLTAEGDNARGIAGAIWASDLTMYSLYSQDGHNPRSRAKSFMIDLAPAIISGAPRVLTISTEFPLDTLQFTPSQASQVDSVLAAVLRNTRTLVVVAAGNAGSRQLDISEIASLDHLALRSSLARLSQAGFSEQVIVVAGTDRNGGIWDGSDVFSGFTDIAAPAAEIDLLGLNRPGTSYSQELYLGSGTSFAAPLVAGVAAQLLSMDPTLTAAQVKDYILRGAQEPIRDPMTGALIDSTQRQVQVPGSGQHLYELDAYGSLTLLARERQGTPICGFPVSTDYSFVTNTGSILIQRDPSAAPVPIITTDPFVRAAELSVAQGGRLLSIGGVPYDGSVAVVSYELQNGVWVQGGYTRGYRWRYYLERDTAYVREGVVDQPDCNDRSLLVTIRGPGGTAIQDLDITGGRDPLASCEGSRDVVFSPDGEWAFTRTLSRYNQCGTTVGSFNVERRYMVNLTTNAGTEVRAPQVDGCGVYTGSSYLTGSEAAWSHAGQDAAIVHFVQPVSGARYLEYEKWVVSGSQIQRAANYNLAPSGGVPAYSPDDIILFLAQSAQGQCESVLHLASDFNQIVGRRPVACPAFPPPYIPNAPPTQRPSLQTKALAAIAPSRTASSRRDLPWRPESIRVN